MSNKTTNTRRQARERRGQSQAEAARAAGVSLATYRRWEDNPSLVSAKTARKCELLAPEVGGRSEGAFGADEISRLVAAWQDSPMLTPRQAAALSHLLEYLSGGHIRQWLMSTDQEPLHELQPFDDLDLRVMMLVAENRAWAAAAAERMRVLADEIVKGTLPFDRPGCYFDELAMALALPHAQDCLADMPELFIGVPERAADEQLQGDDDWDFVATGFDEACQWDEWEVPVRRGHPLIPVVLAERHPFTWFDTVPVSGAGYLRRLAGVEVDEGATEAEQQAARDRANRITEVMFGQQEGPDLT